MNRPLATIDSQGCYWPSPGARIDALEAENARLREALEDALAIFRTGAVLPGMQKIAAALRQPDHPTPGSREE